MDDLRSQTQLWLSNLFSGVDARAAGARRLRRFRVAQTRDVTEKPRLRKSRTLKRPEGRAPAQIVVGAKQIPHRLAEGESTSVGGRIQPLQKVQETDQTVPSPVGRERVRVILFEIHLLSGICFCTNSKG